MLEAFNDLFTVLKTVCLSSHVVNRIFFESNVGSFLFQNIDELFVTSITSDTMDNGERKLSLSQVLTEPFVCRILVC